MVLDNKQATVQALKFAQTFKINKKETQDLLTPLFSKSLFNVSKTNLKVNTVDTDPSKLTAQFNRDLAKQKLVEEALSFTYQCHNYHPTAHYEFNTDSRFDIKVTYTVDNNESYTYIELKNEASAVKWGNLAIEHESWGKPSGINITKANIWISKVEGFYIVFKTSKLIDAINTLPKNVKAGGDSMASLNHILPIRDLVPYMEYIMVDELSHLIK